MKVNRVLGPLTRDNLDVITPHEHIFINLSNFFVNHPVRGIEDPTTAPVKMEYLSELNRDPKLPTIGLIAHMDTSPDASGANIQARVVEYTGAAPMAQD